MLIEHISVLLVEPSSAQRKIIDTHLRQTGIINIVWVKDGNQALNHMADSPPDLVVSAMHLKGMSGTELVQSMRMDENLRNIPFLLISSETHYRYLEPIRQAGVIAILPKPFAFDQLNAAIKSTVNYLDPGELGTRHFAGNELQVLVVDDSFTARNHIKRVLNNMGIDNIAEASNGRAALDMVQQRFFDLIVTDYNMPEMDGRELVEQVRTASVQASVPILMVSSEKDDSRLAAVQQAGVSALCDKPFDADTVKHLIERMIN